MIAKLGCSAGVGYAIEAPWASALKELAVEERTDAVQHVGRARQQDRLQPTHDVTFDFLRGLPYAPAGNGFEHAVSERRKRPPPTTMQVLRRRSQD